MRSILTAGVCYRALLQSATRSVYSAQLDYRYLAIEGPIGVGKTALAERLAARVDATAILEDAENPFLGDFYQEKPGAAFQTQLFFLLNRHRQLSGLRQTELFSQVTICDYLFERGSDLRLPGSERQRAVHLPALVRVAGARHPEA